MALSPQEFEKLKIQLQAKKQSGLANNQQFRSNEGFVGGIKNAFSEREKNIEEIARKGATGEQSDASGLLQTAGQVAGGIGDIGTEALSAITPQPVKDVATSFAKSLAGTDQAQKAIQSYEELKKSNPEAIANLEAVFNIATLIPALKTGQVGAKIGATVAGQTLESGANLLPKTGRIISKTGASTFKSAITPNVQEAERILNYKAKAPFSQRLKSAITGSPIYDEAGQIVSAPITRGQTALEQGIAGTQTMVGVQSKRKSQQLYKNTIQPALANSKDVITKDELFSPILDRINKTVEPGRKKSLQDAFEAIQDEYKDVSNYSLEVAQEVKKGLDEFTPNKVFRGQEIANEYRTLQNDMANAIRQKTYISLKDSNIKKAYIDYGNLKELEKVGVKAITEAGSKGGFGTFWSSAWDMATTPVRTVGGQVLYRVGNKLEFNAPKGIETFGQYLKSQGYAKPKINKPLQ